MNKDKEVEAYKSGNLTPEEQTKYGIAQELGILDSNFNFIIPVYENMPSLASPKPGRNVTLTTEDVIVQTQSTDLVIRTGPLIGSEEKARAPKGTKLIRIEKAGEARNRWTFLG